VAELSPKEIAIERVKCSLDPAYFIDTYCWIEVAHNSSWERFHPWPSQIDMLKLVCDNDKLILLKARQLGFTWILVAYSVWMAVFRPGSRIIVFSIGAREAKIVIWRCNQVLKRLPDWLLNVGFSGLKMTTEFTNGSSIESYPSTAGNSLTATVAILDEADKVKDLEKIFAAVKPTTDAGGKLIILSSVEKSRPESFFKSIYRDAKAGRNGFVPVFQPWSAKPTNTQEWYEIQKRDYSRDKLWQEYPATDAEALAPDQKDKLIDSEWLNQCYEKMDPIKPDKSPAIPGLKIFREPVVNEMVGTRRYVIGSDTAEGKKKSDDSVATALDIITGEEVACFCGKFDPSMLGQYLEMLSQYYNNAPVLVERNNHGHAVIVWFRLTGSNVRLINGLDGSPGWNTNEKGKAILYSNACETFRDADCKIHSFETWEQLANIEGRTKSAPQGQHDDRAVSFVIALYGCVLELKVSSGKIITGGDSISKSLPDDVNPHKIQSVASMLDTMKF
jgi:hypothetical protein